MVDQYRHIVAFSFQLAHLFNLTSFFAQQAAGKCPLLDYNPTKYENTPQGFDKNVTDAIAEINFWYESIANEEGVDHYGGWFWNSHPYDETIVTVVRSVLYYNIGADWIRSYKAEIRNNNGSEVGTNKPYLEKVGINLRDYVPKNFDYRDPILAKALLFTQEQMIDVCVDTENCGIQ